MFMQIRAEELEIGSSRRVALKTWGMRAVIVLCLIVGGLYGVPKITYALAHESTDDAFVEGVVVPISSEVKGRVLKVFVADNQAMKAGEPLVEIAADDYSNLVQARQDSMSRMTAEQQETHALIKVKTMTLARARADLDAMETSAALAEKDLKRSTELRKQEVISQSQYDQAESRAKDTLARKASASAAVAEIEASIEALNAQLQTQKFKMREAGTALNLATARPGPHHHHGPGRRQDRQEERGRGKVCAARPAAPRDRG